MGNECDALRVYTLKVNIKRYELFFDISENTYNSLYENILASSVPFIFFYILKKSLQ